MTTRTAFLALAAAVAALAVGLFSAELQGDAVISDTPVYRTYGERIASGDTPYRDFRVEYPPGALVPFVVPALVSSSPHGFDARCRMSIRSASSSRPTAG